MAQRVKVFAVKPNDPGSVPGIADSCKRFPDLHRRIKAWAHSHPPTPTHHKCVYMWEFEQELFTWAYIFE